MPAKSSARSRPRASASSTSRPARRIWRTCSCRSPARRRPEPTLARQPAAGPAVAEAGALPFAIVVDDVDQIALIGAARDCRAIPGAVAPLARDARALGPVEPGDQVARHRDGAVGAEISGGDEV